MTPITPDTSPVSSLYHKMHLIAVTCFLLSIFRTTLSATITESITESRTESYTSASSWSSSCISTSRDGKIGSCHSESSVTINNGPRLPESTDSLPAQSTVNISSPTNSGSQTYRSQAPEPVNDFRFGNGSSPVQSPPNTDQTDNFQSGNGSSPIQSPVPPPENLGFPIQGKRERHSFLLAINIAIPLIVIVMITVFLIVLFFYKRRNPRHIVDQETHRNLKMVLAANEHRAPKRFNYSDIKKMTKDFSDKLGEGGYGTVYKGHLQDGRAIAVKLLTETRRNGEEFINEVASISKTAHVNIVELLGFCCEGRKRALVYQFMPKKSLDNFTCGTECQVDWNILSNIALGIAKGLQYLHRDCKPSIVHFDIKPQNILLDEDFCPKISDFGLAKLCKDNKSVLTTLAGARGTGGYIAPEVYNRNYGKVSHKADVYSYGMVLLDMTADKNNIGTGTFETESCYSDIIYRHFEHIENMTLNNEDMEDVVARKLYRVGFWCIQPRPADRPSMSAVVSMLEGSIESVKIPPKPCLFSSP